MRKFSGHQSSLLEQRKVGAPSALPICCDVTSAALVRCFALEDVRVGWDTVVRLLDVLAGHVVAIQESIWCPQQRGLCNSAIV